MKKRKLLKIQICLLMVFVLLTGCSQNATPSSSNSNNNISLNNNSNSNGNSSSKKSITSSLELASTLKEKYSSDKAKYDFAVSTLNINRDEELAFSINFDPYLTDLDSLDDIICLYRDADLTQPIFASIHWDESNSQLTVSPPDYNKLSINIGGLDEEILNNYPYQNYTLFYKEKDWGNLGKYYMAQYVDLESGEKLDTPLVTIVTIKGELNTPNIKFTVTENGTASFSWKPVTNAERYLIIQTTSYNDSGLSGACSVIGETTDTNWTAPNKTFASEIKTSNEDFRIYSISEDDWLNPSTKEIYASSYKEEDGVVLLQEDATEYYGVIAISKDGNSMVSNLYGADEIASLLPYHEARNMGQTAGRTVKHTEQLPTHAWIVLCDGRVKQNLVNYNIEKADTMTMNVTGDEPDSPVVPITNLLIPYTIDGTAFTGTASIITTSTDTLTEDLQALLERQEALRSKTGFILPEIQQKAASDTSIAVTDAPDNTTSKSNQLSDIFVQEDDISKITANNALSEYLAAHMLSGVDNIDLTPFKESLDTDYLFDAWQEAIYQNPLILGANTATVSADGKTLYVTYEDDITTIQQKQEEIKTEVKKIISDIIEPNMTDLEKEFAINQYLCDNVTYDYDALENAERYNFEKTDSEFNDSFTAYGAIIKKYGVCASYAGAFKLLANASNLNSIVVSGTLEGSVPHAWNKVNIDNQWYILDPTNNNMEYLPNVLLNLSDKAAKSALVEDTDFVLDTTISQYQSKSDDREYYRLNDKYFNLDSIASALAKDLKTNQTALLRTEYTLTDAQFDDILTKTQELSQAEMVSGIYWMGVIFVTLGDTSN